MTELKELKKLVKEGEGAQLEFKLKTTHPEKIMREVVAFANSQGGTLLLGVADNAELIGLKFPDEDAFVMEKSFARYIYPKVSYSREEIVLENGKPVLAYRIKKAEEAIVYFNPIGEQEDRKVYIRQADRSIQASKEVKEILKEKLKEKSYRFNYGTKEEILMKYLDLHEQITVQTFAQEADISPKQASKTLVLLVLARVLRVLPGETEDHFVLA